MYFAITHLSVDASFSPCGLWFKYQVIPRGMRRSWSDTDVIVRRVRKIAESDYSLRNVCPSVHMEQLGSHWTYFHEIWYLGIFRKSV